VKLSDKIARVELKGYD